MAPASPVPPRIQSGDLKLRYPASSKDWQDHRQNFERLYVTENKPLRAAMAEMARIYGFEATYVRRFHAQARQILNQGTNRERQYKRRITEWRLDKNIKDDEMRAMLRKAKERRRQGKDSVFYVRGRLVDPKKMERFSLRKNTKGDTQCDGETGESDDNKSFLLC